MKPKHTPGPWKFRQLRTKTDGTHLGAKCGLEIYAGAPILGSLATVNGPALDADIMEANAQLIAQAPAMLDLLRRLNAAIHRDEIAGYFKLQDIIDLDDLMKAFGKN